MKNNYNTSQKKLIKDFLIKNKNKFINVDDILKHINKDGQIVGTTTIYRYLNSLEEQEAVRTEIINHTKYYQYITNECMDHFHLKCKKCGKTIHLHCDEFKKVSDHIKEEHSFNIDYNTIIYGICDKCIEE